MQLLKTVKIQTLKFKEPQGWMPIVSDSWLVHFTIKDVVMNHHRNM